MIDQPEDGTWPPSYRCGSDPVIPPSPLRRLTNSQYRSAVTGMFPGVDLEFADLPSPQVAQLRTYENDVVTQAIGSDVLDSYQATAQGIADAVLEDSSWAGCDVDQLACVSQVAERVTERAYRRALRAEERAGIAGLLATEGLTPRDLLAVYVEALLLTPQFLYAPELGDPVAEAPPGARALTPHELATRLSLFLVDAPPDDVLLEAAASGELSEPGAYEAQVDRLLATEAAQRAFDRFFSEWLEQDRVRSASAALFPELSDDALRADLEASYAAFARHVLWGSGSLDELLTSREGFVNDRLASVFGVPAPGSDALVRTTLPEGERAGVLTQPSVLASTSHGITHSPVLRGLLVLDRFLCDRPAFPAQAFTEPELDAERPMAVTTRERFEDQHVKPECAGCHHRIDGAGFTFESYDAVGRYRTEEFGIPVDSTGQLGDTVVDDALGLSARLSRDARVPLCIGTHFYRFALGRAAVREDDC
ncbi:MAG: DUF1592 domain-containing protein, partial [Sandaracinus sp.]|nr:DUF1592 domain-containing protein [Sandaracinus sp.]